MSYEHLLFKLENYIHLNNIHKMTDTEIIILYIKIGDILVNYIKLDKLNKNKILTSTFKQLKTVFAQIKISDLASLKALYQLSLDYHKLDVIKELLKQICSQNKILIIQNTNSTEQVIANIKNSINTYSYIDKYTKSYYCSQIRTNGDAILNFTETIKLLTIFNKI